VLPDAGTKLQIDNKNGAMRKTLIKQNTTADEKNISYPY
jgi:hypothetical protein